LSPLFFQDFTSFRSQAGDKPDPTVNFDQDLSDIHIEKAISITFCLSWKEKNI